MSYDDIYGAQVGAGGWFGCCLRLRVLGSSWADAENATVSGEVERKMRIEMLRAVEQR
jgi:hypothetical protein